MRKITLNIYEKGKVVTTHSTDSADIMYGTVEDLLDAINLDNLEDVTEIAKTVRKAMPLIKPLLFDVFPDMTEEELRKTKIKELISCVMQIVKTQIEDLTALLPEQD